ncbi:unnamed protein product [Phytomonas sp. Hart1]|nr:unnamed protein product [Phytomonas sp. Hart1]|eukprot:CCW67882.1 unnamed protein product [Phytomonas sp. isolate Hart1]
MERRKTRTSKLRPEEVGVLANPDPQRLSPAEVKEESAESPQERIERGGEGEKKGLRSPQVAPRHHSFSSNHTNGSERPSQQQTMTAGKAPPKAKPTHEVIPTTDAVATPTASNVAAGIIPELRPAEKGTAEDSASEEDWMNIVEKAEARPMHLSSADGVEDMEVRGHIARKAMQAKLDQEEARKAREAAVQSALNSDGGIIIRSNNRTGMHATGAGSGAVMNEADLTKLRENLQLLTKASNPLGKFLEAIHDDIDSMTRELETWRSEARNQALAAMEAQQQTEESVQAVQVKLQSIEDEISDQILKTGHLQQTIFTNDRAIEGMVRMLIGPENLA